MPKKKKLKPDDKLHTLAQELSDNLYEDVGKFFEKASGYEGGVAYQAASRAIAATFLGLIDISVMGGMAEKRIVTGMFFNDIENALNTIEEAHREIKH